MQIAPKKRIRQIMSSLVGVLILYGLSFTEVWALTENAVITHWDSIFYSVLFTGIFFSAATVTAYRAYEWLVYVLFAFLLTLNIASIDGTLSALIGQTDFTTWVVPYLITTITTAYGYWLIALRIESTHALSRFKLLFYSLAVISLLFPASSVFWLGIIPLSLMWIPVNFLFFGMILGQILPPLTWTSQSPTFDKFIRTFPVLVCLFSVIAYLLHFTGFGFNQHTLNLINRVAIVLFASSSLAIVIWKVVLNAYEKDLADRQILEAEKQQAELKLSLMEAEQNYQHAQTVAADHRSRLATVSHDLKQPITALRIAIDQIQQDAPEAEKLSRAVDYIASLAHAYIDEGSTIENNLSEDSLSKKEPVSTRLFSDTLLQMFADTAQKQGIKLTSYCAENLVFIEPLSTLRVLTNVVGNALSHAAASRIVIGFRRRHDKVIFQVHDNGCGMSQAMLDTVFDPLVKSEASDGHGLGLAIVKELCEAQDLTFNLHSTVGKGTSIYIAMPVSVNKLR